ncbi:hypothetical protein DRP53_08935 [candidate division WOR-3 bacterium]|uniref:Flagellar assembly protein T N-terminal domain-containing protein n=1 Tax=candidate division WOR-3 bacterium TaxID=2052148 RepID=A0A660SGT9_UNCW3|nr:MAG: hypothetical protein DRP53_08935 [candidate division WOR-3 bacterium]
MNKITHIISLALLCLACTKTYLVRESTTTLPIKEKEVKTPLQETPVETTREIFADGVAAITATVDIARDHAIADALRKAIERGVGTFLDSKTLVRNHILLKDEIYSKARGYISSYRIIDEGEEENLYRVKVLAKVKVANLKDDLEAIGLLLREKGRPRIMVVIKEFREGSERWDKRVIEFSDIETMIIEKFAEKGFPVVDAATVKRNLRVEQIRCMLQGDNKTAALIGLKAGAEIIVTGKAMLSEEEKSIPYAQGARRFYQTKINCRAINTETAEVLTAASITKDLPFSEESSKREAAEEISRGLIKDILGKWQREENVTQIYIAGAEYSEILKLKSNIHKKIRGVSKVIQRDLTGDLAILEVLSTTSSQEILDDLGSIDLGVDLKIKAFSGNRIDIEIRKPSWRAPESGP